jgi:hypothetical protein
MILISFSQFSAETVSKLRREICELQAQEQENEEINILVSVPSVSCIHVYLSRQVPT